MPEVTKFLELEKPLGTENYDINVHNRNADKLDAATAALTTEVAGKANINGAEFTGKVKIFNNRLEITPDGVSTTQCNMAYALPPDSTLAAKVNVGLYKNLLRIYEDGGNSRGAYIDISKCAIGVGTPLATATPIVTPLTPLNGFEIAGNKICKISNCGAAKVITAELKFTANAPVGTTILHTGVNGVHDPVIASIFGYNREYLRQAVLWHYTDGRITAYAGLTFSPEKGEYNILQINTTLGG